MLYIRNIIVGGVYSVCVICILLYILYICEKENEAEKKLFMFCDKSHHSSRINPLPLCRVDVR